MAANLSLCNTRRQAHELDRRGDWRRRTRAASGFPDSRIDVLVSRVSRKLSLPSTESEAHLAENVARDPIASYAEPAKNQQYEVASEFFGHVLGAQRKYSCCRYAEERISLDEAEIAALEETLVHADLRDGQRILELGCGWERSAFAWRSGFQWRGSRPYQIRSHNAAISKPRRGCAAFQSSGISHPLAQGAAGSVACFKSIRQKEIVFLSRPRTASSAAKRNRPSELQPFIQ
jgi:hypothetical protein